MNLGVRLGGGLLAGLLVAPILPAAANSGGERPVQVGSKAFTESVILGEIATQVIRSTGTSARHRRELGGTRVLWSALRNGEIDVYAEYSGTLLQEILAGRGLADLPRAAAALRDSGIGMTPPLGFNNTYVLGMRETLAEQLGVSSISDLRRHPTLRFGFSNEFMNRVDGWPGLRSHYALPQRDVRGMDHDLAYRGLASNDLQVTDLYATDAEIAYYGLRPLRDDRHYFPAYQAIFLYRVVLEKTAPAAMQALHALAGRIEANTMVAMNARVKLAREPEARVAAEFLRNELGLAADPRTVATWRALLRHTRDHLVLVAVSLGAAILIAIPLGVAAIRWPRAGQVILGVTGMLQTIPSLALLVLMIPVFGIGAVPAIMALFLYSLLPIVRNTHAGLAGIPASIRESAEALGLPGGARLRLIELPMASRSILAGIKTSAVINVGTATLGALIGAGGYGQPILTGIRLDDFGLILQGAVPAAVLALLAQGGFDIAERVLVPRGLR